MNRRTPIDFLYRFRQCLLHGKRVEVKDVGIEKCRSDFNLIERTTISVSTSNHAMDSRLASVPLDFHNIIKLMDEALGDHAVFMDIYMSKDNRSCYVWLFQQKAVTIRIGPKSSYLSFDPDLLKTPLEETMSYTHEKDTGLVRLHMDMSFNMDSFLHIFQELSLYYRKYPSVERFGCCHEFKRCSDDRRCLHFDSFDALGCYYRENLEKGLIFYGRNASNG